MFVIPFQINQREYSIFIALQHDNLERIAAYDPAEVQMDKIPLKFARLRLKDILIGYSTEDELRQVLQLLEAGQSRDALKLLARGFAFKPNAGDHDGPYLSLKKQPGETKQ